MPVKFFSLSSSSSGNSYLITNENTKIIIDAGISARKIENFLLEEGIDINEVDGILITHEHIDHIKSVETLHKKYNTPIFCNEKTFLEAAKIFKKPENIKVKNFNAGDNFYINDIEVKAFSIPHDAADPVGFSFYYKDFQVSLATDVGHITEEIFDEIHSADLLILESNHDTNMLKMCRYPWFTKKRILGDLGHLSNEDAGKTIAKIHLKEEKKRRIFLAHLSRESNFPQMAQETIKNILFEHNILDNTNLLIDIIKREEFTVLYGKDI